MKKSEKYIPPQNGFGTKKMVESLQILIDHSVALIKDLPVDKHPFQLYFKEHQMSKVTIMLEELLNLGIQEAEHVLG